jgi:hypothetical protein
MTDDPIVLSLCDRTGNMVRPWADAGYECWCVDIQHDAGERRDGNIVWVGADVLEWLPPLRKYAAVFAFPPCTNLASSGARWYRDKGLEGLYDGLRLVIRAKRVCEWASAPWMLENPIGTLSTYWREPDYRFDPADYAGYLDNPDEEAYTKRTCLWTGGGFTMPEAKPVFALQGSKMHLLPPSDDRADLRSVTPKGFALAVFLANREAQQEAA